MRSENKDCMVFSSDTLREHRDPLMQKLRRRARWAPGARYSEDSRGYSKKRASAGVSLGVEARIEEAQIDRTDAVHLASETAVGR